MLELKRIREDKVALIAALNKRGLDAEKLMEEIIHLDERRRSIIAESEDLKRELNEASRNVGTLFKEGKKEEAELLRNRSADLKTAIKALEDQLTKAEQGLQLKLYETPNAPHASVPEGKSAEDNETVYEWGHIRSDDNLLPHWELTSKYGLIDFELGVKISGAGFPVYLGKGAKLQRALINFFLNEAAQAGFEEVQVPHLVNEASGIGTGQLPDKEGQMYHTELDKLYLIPTAEVPVTNLYRDVILDAKDLPVKNCAYTPCFRREAGSYGKDVRGLNRLHQFDKVEIVQIAKPQDSYGALHEMLEHSKALLEKLNLPYRVLKLCGGDMGFTSALTYDLEVWSAGQQRWLEVSSVSNFETFQTNRLKLRYRDENNKTQLAHSLNGSALALPRIVAAILENYQSADGIDIPEVLRPYTGFNKID